jgi:hypothetical protein
MEFFIARHQIEQETRRQFADAPVQAEERVTTPAPARAGVLIAIRARLSAGLRAVAGAIEPTHPEPAPAAGPRR